MGQPIIIMVSANPELTGLLWATACRYIGRNVVRPIIAIPANSVARLHTAIGRIDQSLNDSIGSAARRSTITNAMLLSTNNASSIAVSDVSELVRCVRKSINAVTITMKSAAPP